MRLVMSHKYYKKEKVQLTHVQFAHPEAMPAKL